MSHGFSIPERSSSKRDFADIEADRKDRRLLDTDIDREAKKVRAAGSFDSNYWTQLREVSELRVKRSVLSLRLLQDELGDESALKESDEARRLQEEAHLHTLEAEIFRKQASRAEVKPEKFRKKLIKACKSRSPTPRSHDLWCPILGHFFPDKSMHAAHIFPWAEGQVAMDEIFGREDENMEELNEIPNGLMLSTYAEERLEDGDIVLVPDVTDAASQEEIDAWSKSEPKEYKIRVVNPEAKGMNWLHPGDVNPRRSWNELDGRKVQFSSDHRPRARYLYWQYCKTMLRHSWKKKGIKAKDVLLQERAKKFWGTKGPYIKKRMLLAFVEQLGHDHEALMENARVESEDDNIPDSDPSALLLASAEIRKSHQKYMDEEDDEDDEDDEDEEAEESSDV